MGARLLVVGLASDRSQCSFGSSGGAGRHGRDVNHQPEPMLPTDAKYNFVADQIVTTRDVECPDPLTEYLFGGMQYQLEHHLFPFMPKYRYRAVREHVKKFAEDHGMEYKSSGIVEIMQRNYEVMKKYSQTR